MERLFLLNYDALDKYLNEQQKNPNRTDWELTMLRNNCKKYLKKTLNPKEYKILVNESTGDITINWQEDLKDKFNMLPTWYKMSNKSGLYRQVKLAMDEAKSRWIYEQIFKEIKDF